MKTLRMVTNSEAQSIMLCLILRDEVAYNQAELIIKNAVVEKGWDNLDLLFSYSSVLVKGEEHLCLRIESYFLPAMRDKSDAKKWRMNFFYLMDEVMDEISEWGVFQDVNNKVNYILKDKTNEENESEEVTNE